MMDDLDRILVSEGGIAPSDGFLASVMEAVRERCPHEIPIPFPWGRFAGGLIGGLCGTALSVVLLAPELTCLRPLGTAAWLPIPRWLCASEIVFAAIVLVGSLLAVRCSVDVTSTES